MAIIFYIGKTVEDTPILYAEINKREFSVSAVFRVVDKKTYNELFRLKYSAKQLEKPFGKKIKASVCEKN